MKLRVREDSIRLRLTRGEVDALRETGRVDETLEVTPGAALGWSLVRRDAIDGVSAVLDAGVLRIEVPAALAREWCDTDRVGFDGKQTVGARTIRILVEKDWSCLKPREDEDDTDAYPHPLAKKP